MKLICDTIGDGWRMSYPRGVVECNDPLWFFYIVGIVILIGWIVPALFSFSGEDAPAPQTTALAKREPAMDIEYIDDMIEVRQGDTVVIQNSKYQREATAKENTRIGVKRKWRGW